MICQETNRQEIPHRLRISWWSEPHQIQVREPHSGLWRMYARFRFQGEAEACLDLLRQRGIEARIIEG